MISTNSNTTSFSLNDFDVDDIISKLLVAKR